MTDKPAASGESLRRIIAEFGAGNHQSAIEQVSRMHTETPGNAETANALGLMLAQIDRFDDAIIVLRRAVATEFLNPGYYADLATAYFNSGDGGRALDCIVTSLALDPTNPGFHKAAAFISVDGARSGKEALETEIYPGNQLGNFNVDGRTITALLDERNYYQVIAEGRKILIRRPGDVRAHYCLAVALQSHNHVGPVIDHLRVVAKSMPAFAGACKGLGDFLHQAWRLKAIRNEFAEAVMDQPSPNAGPSYLTEAGDNYRTALFHQPDDAITRLYYGNLLCDLGDMSGSSEQYHLAARLEPGRIAAHYNLARAMLRAGELTQASDQVDAAIALQPGFREALGLKAILLAHRGDRLGAGMTHLSAIDLEPKFSTEVYF
ncbi:MAG: tetratricopeptide repeat protein [Rhodospirillales bacterium]|jgi:Flp pilus assembly protein TadD|nr:tetratricopeptide repeat protein [Rhodospirillales bacterium]